MDLVDMSFEDRYSMMRKRHLYLNEIAKLYTSLDDFAKGKDEWFAIVGVELTHCGEYISLFIPLGFNEYETYHVIPGRDGHLTISEVIWWEHPYCFNDVMNIFTEESVEEEDILTSIHNYDED